MGFSTFEVMLIRSAVEHEIETIKKAIEASENEPRIVTMFSHYMKYYEDLLTKLDI